MRPAALAIAEAAARSWGLIIHIERELFSRAMSEADDKTAAVAARELASAMFNRRRANDALQAELER